MSQFLLNPKMDQQTQQYFAQLKEVAPRLENHIWVASSGSSSVGRSGLKIMALSQTALSAAAAGANEFLQASAADHWLLCLPEFHVGGLAIGVRAFLSGSQVSRLESWDVESFCEAIARHRITLTSLVPTQVFDLVAAGKAAPAPLRAIVVGGAKLSSELYYSARQLGWPLLPSFGMSECCSQVATAPLSSLDMFVEPRMRRLPHIEWRTDENQKLWIRSSALLTGWCRFEGDRAIYEDPKVDGWLQTSDRAHLFDDAIEVLGREAENIKILGELVDLAEVRNRWENWCHTHWRDGVVAATLVDIPDARSGAQIVCAVEPTALPGAELSVQVFNQGLPPYSRVEKVLAIPKIPRSQLGKVLWAELRQSVSRQALELNNSLRR